MWEKVTFFATELCILTAQVGEADSPLWVCREGPGGQGPSEPTVAPRRGTARLGGRAGRQCCRCVGPLNSRGGEMKREEPPPGTTQHKLQQSLNLSFIALSILKLLKNVKKIKPFKSESAGMDVSAQGVVAMTTRGFSRSWAPAQTQWAVA